MRVEELLRVVALRKGKLKAVEFRLRDGGRGLSLFARVDEPSPAGVVAAVRAAGKQGDLAAAVIRSEALRASGLKLVRTRGGTPDAEVNAIHFEARLSRWRRVLLFFQGIQPHEFFNNRLAQRLCDAARVIE